MKKCYIFGHKFELNPDRGDHWGDTHRCIYNCGYKTNNPGKGSKYIDTFWRSDAWDTIVSWFKVILVVLIILLIIVGIIYWISNSTCIQYKNMGINVLYNFWTGCMANHPKFGWIPVEKYFEVLNLYVK